MNLEWNSADIRRREELLEFLPEKIIDCHTHIWKKEQMEAGGNTQGMVSWTTRVAAENPVEDLAETHRMLFPGKTVIPAVMTSPRCRLDEGNAYVRGVAKTYGFPAYCMVRHDTPTEEMERAVREFGFAGFKPYVNFAAPYIPAKEVRIFDMFTPRQWAVADALRAVVMLHLPRPGRLKDPVNLAQLAEIDRAYPNAKVIVAHVGRAYSPEDLGEAFSVLRRTRNLLFDFSANTLPEAMVRCVDAVGPRRILFGSDLPITRMRMYRITEEGRYVNVVPRGLYGDVSGDPHMRESDESDIGLFLYEEISAFRACAKTCGLSKADVEDVFFRNAARIFGTETSL